MNSRSEPTNVSRRAVLLGFSAGAFVLTTRLTSPAHAQEKRFGGDGMPGGLKDDPHIFLSIEDDETVVLLCHRGEMGQGMRTSWAMVVADQLEADMARVRVVQAPGDQARFSNQNTDGFRSMRHHFWPLRRIAAAARRMLEDEAASRWSVPVADVRSENHAVLHPASGRCLGLGALARGASARPVPARDVLTFKAADRFRYIGKDNISLVDNFDITTACGSLRRLFPVSDDHVPVSRRGPDPPAWGFTGLRP